MISGWRGTVGPRHKIELGSGRVPSSSSYLLDAPVHPGGWYPRMVLNWASGGSHILERCSSVLGPAVGGVLVVPL
eukprot:4152628-Pyramimonas_sp.AAC.1